MASQGAGLGRLYGDPEVPSSQDPPLGVTDRVRRTARPIRLVSVRLQELPEGVTVLDHLPTGLPSGFLSGFTPLAFNSPKPPTRQCDYLTHSWGSHEYKRRKSMNPIPTTYHPIHSTGLRLTRQEKAFHHLAIMMLDHSRG